MVNETPIATRAISRVHCGSAASFRRELALGDEPLIVTGLVETWLSSGWWTLDHLRRAYGELQLRVGVRMPTDRSPYEVIARDHL
ncbi:MAG: hypothetical protein RLW62_14505, partial [Gammaproteobacteria bacterium]